MHRCNVSLPERGRPHCLAASEAALPTVALDGGVALLTMVRRPLDHVVSMYGQCQSPHSDGQRSTRFPRISFEGWVRLAAASSGASGAGRLLQHCYYDPRNFQTTVLGPGRDAAVHTVRSSMWTGVTESFDASLCLLLSLTLNRAACSCSGPLDRRHAALPHSDHNTNSSLVERTVSLSLHRTIRSFTAHDAVVHAAALTKLHDGLEAFGLTVLAVAGRWTVRARMAFVCCVTVSCFCLWVRLHQSV